MAEWKSQKLGDIGEIAAVAEGAKGAAEAVATTLTLASTAMELVKLLAQLQSVNPLLIALNLLADEVLKALSDIKEAGYWMLWVDPYFAENVKAAKTDATDPANMIGFERQRDAGGAIIYETETTAPFNVKTVNINGKLEKLPALVTPFKMVKGGWNPLTGGEIDPLGTISTFPKFSTKKVIKEMQKAFEDKGDVAKYVANDIGLNIENGGSVFDSSGGEYSGWDSGKEFGLQLYDVGTSSQDGSVIKDFKASRKQINTLLKVGKPNLKGGTSGVGFGAGAVAIVIGAPDFSVFVETFNSLGAFFGDVADFGAGMGKKLSDKMKD